MRSMELPSREDRQATVVFVERTLLQLVSHVGMDCEYRLQEKMSKDLARICSGYLLRRLGTSKFNVRCPSFSETRHVDEAKKCCGQQSSI